jgi:ribonuclease BN (tRNA processing enzyme)
LLPVAVGGRRKRLLVMEYVMASKVTFVGCGDAFGSGGRFNTCILVDVPGVRFAIDFGASSLVALNALGISHNSIDIIVCTHIHGDHCGGVPFLLLDAMLGAKRQQPLVIAGPRGIEAGILAMRDALFPGMNIMRPSFPLEFVEIAPLTPREIGPLKVTSYPAQHTRETNPTSVRVEAGEKVVSYTGDSAWTEYMPALAKDADVFIAECYFFRKAVRFHLNYPDLKAHWSELRAKRIVLTHMGPEMLAQAQVVPEECAYDGMVVPID